MNLASIMQIGLALISAMPTIEGSIAAITALVSHVHSVSDAATAAEAIVGQLPNIINAATANLAPPPPVSAILAAQNQAVTQVA